MGPVEGGREHAALILMCRKKGEDTDSDGDDGGGGGGNGKSRVGGGKTIGMFASVALLINNITGPGVPSLPNMFAESGWLFPTVVLLAVWSLSSVSTTMCARTEPDGRARARGSRKRERGRYRLGDARF